MTISRLLVANRAEIASRVFRTCRRLGIETVAVCSEADAGLPYAGEADVTVPLVGSTPAETYLRADVIVAAALAHGADAVHPGYGFLSENADFARAVIDAGLTWVGPTPESIEKMGSKVEAKRLMAAAGVPVLSAPDEPTEPDLPLLVKASAGGGGRGMRVVRRLEDLAREISAASAEAASAFGDGTVFVEPYVEIGRHVEVQVVGDGRGGVLVLGERDCSVQRRHQKVVEESPAPLLPEATRAALHEAASAAAGAISYRGAGTVEFLYDPVADRFWFLEMNTRLQVEHPVTEMVWDVDLVALQLEVAEGGSGARAAARAPTSPHRPSGHAIEVRLYAEDPAADHRPQSGTLTRLEIPEGEGLRVDTGYAGGSIVSTFYDAMLAKVIAHAPTREGAARALAGALSRATIHGLTTNRDQLVTVLRSPEFLAGDVGGDLLGRLPAGPDRQPVAVLAAHAATVARAALVAERRTVQRGVQAGWRNVPSQPHRTTWRWGEDEIGVAWTGGRGSVGFPEADGEVVATGPGVVRLRWEQGHHTLRVTLADDGDTADVDGVDGHVRLTLVPRFTDPADAVASGSLLAPMPGTVVMVAVEHDAEVSAGQPVLVIEAMKMQHTVAAPHNGVVTLIDVQVGQQVAAGEVLAVVVPTPVESGELAGIPQQEGQA